MKRVDNPTFHANDGTIFSTPHKAASHDAEALLRTMFNESLRDGDDVSFKVMASKWQELQRMLTNLSNELHQACLAGERLPEEVYYSQDHDNFYSFDKHKGLGHHFYAKWQHRRHEFPKERPEDWGVVQADLPPEVGLPDEPFPGPSGARF